MIDKIKFKIDKQGTAGVKLSTNVRRHHDGSLRVETLVFLSSNGMLQPMKTHNNIFVPTNDLTKQVYFQFEQVSFIGKAIINIGTNDEYLSMAISQANYQNSAISPKGNNDGDILITWQPIQVTEQIEQLVKQFCKTFIY